VKSEPAKKKKKRKKRAAKATKKAGPGRGRKKKVAKETAETIRIRLEVDEATMGRFKTIYEWHKTETDGSATADELAMDIFQSGLEHFEKSLDNGDGEAKEAASGNLIDLDEEEDEEYDAQFEEFVSP
jgi:hypothetical protein